MHASGRLQNHRRREGRMPRPVAKYIGDASVIPPDSKQSQPAIYVLRQLGVASQSLRTKPDPNNEYSFRFPLEVWASSRAEAIRLLRQTTL